MNLNYYCDILKEKIHRNEQKNMCFMGGILLSKNRRDKTNDVDAFYFGKNTDDIIDKFNGFKFMDSKKLDITDSISLQDYFWEDISLAQYMIMEKGFIVPVDGYDFKKLSYKGLFLSKLACLDNRESFDLMDKDMDDLNWLSGKIPNIIKNLAPLIENFGLNDSFNEFGNYLK